MSNELPVFRYHPEPVASGSIVQHDIVCVVCRRQRSHVYVGPVYCEVEDLSESVCPWCIFDGKANADFGAEFHDTDGIEGEIPGAVIHLLATKTPGITGWQQERWLTCCGDAMAYLGPAGHVELYAADGEFDEVVRLDTGLEREAWLRFRSELNRQHGPTAYLFRCLQCGAPGAYQDHS